MIALVVTLACVGVAFASDARRRGTAELQVKAAFILNFAAFVEWPPSAFRDATAPLVVGVYGEDPFGPALDEILAGEVTRERSFIVRRLRPGADPTGCHILFVSDSERRRWSGVLASLRRQPVLTVGNGPDFNEAGGIIEFVTERGRIRFRINVQAAEAAGLVLSSKLLRLAQNSPINVTCFHRAAPATRAGRAEIISFATDSFPAAGRAPLLPPGVVAPWPSE